MANRITTWSDGETLTDEALNGEFNNLYTGDISRTAGYWGQQDDIPVQFGSSQDASLRWLTTGTTDSLVIGTPDYVYIMSQTDAATATQPSGTGIPGLVLYSGTASDNQSTLLRTATANFLINPSASVTSFTLQMGVTARLKLDNNGQFQFNDSGTANANMTQGITIDQSGNDDEIIALKSSTDVAHGMTDDAETDTYGTLLKAAATTGGLRIDGYGEGEDGPMLRGSAATDDTAKTTAGNGYVSIDAATKSSATRGAAGADANLLVVRNLTTTRFIFDAEGSFHADVESTTFDEYDDVALIRDLEAEMLRDKDPVQADLIGAARYNRKLFEDLKLVHFDDNNPGHAMVNLTRLPILSFGAIRQLDARITALEKRV